MASQTPGQGSWWALAAVGSLAVASVACRPGASGSRGTAVRVPSWIEVDSGLFRESGANANDLGKVARYASVMRRAGGWGRFPPVSGQIGAVDEGDLQNYREAEEGGYEHELAWSRPLTRADLGRLYVNLEDGHHRSYAAREVGIPIRVRPFSWLRGPWSKDEIRQWWKEHGA